MGGHATPRRHAVGRAAASPETPRIQGATRHEPALPRTALRTTIGRRSPEAPRDRALHRRGVGVRAGRHRRGRDDGHRGLRRDARDHPRPRGQRDSGSAAHAHFDGALSRPDAPSAAGCDVDDDAHHHRARARRGSLRDDHVHRHDAHGARGSLPRRAIDHRAEHRREHHDDGLHAAARRHVHDGVVELRDQALSRDGGGDRTGERGIAGRGYFDGRRERSRLGWSRRCSLAADLDGRRRFPGVDDERRRIQCWDLDRRIDEYWDEPR